MTSYINLPLHSNLFQEGRASEYFDVFGTGQYITEHDFRYNRIPEVLVMDHCNNKDVPMSFHDIHLLGNQAVFQMIITPRVRDSLGFWYFANFSPIFRPTFTIIS